MSGHHSLGQILNEAVRIKPSSVLSQPKSGHVTFAEMFWETLSSASAQESVATELNRVMNFLLTQAKRETRTERAVWFICFAFARMLISTDPDQRSSANSFLATLCDRSICENKTVRFRTCQCIRLVLDQLPEQPDVDGDVTEAIYATLFARVRDRSQEVRTQALLALDRFKVAGDGGDYAEDHVTAAYFASLKSDPHHHPRAAVLNGMPLVPQTIKAVCERTQDVHEIVRTNAFKVIAQRLNPEMMGTQWSGEVMWKGLNDRSDFVRPLAERTLLSWFDEHVHEDVAALFNFFSWETHPDIFPIVMELLLKHRLHQVVQWNQTHPSPLGKREELEPQMALFWKTFVCGCKRRGDALGRDAATDPDKAAEAQVLFDLVDDILSASLEAFLQSFEVHLRDQKMDACCQMLKILTVCFNFTDEGDKAAASEIYDKLCRCILPRACPDWYPSVVAFGHVLWPETSEFLQVTMMPLEEISMSFQNALMEVEESVPFHHWLLLSVEMLRSIPLRTNQVFSLGTPSFSIAETLQILKMVAGSVPDSSDLKRWIIEGIGICLALKLTPDEHAACLPLIWSSFESTHAETATAAVHALCTLGMSHGVRRIDRKPTAPIASKPFLPLWECKITVGRSEEPSLPMRFAFRIPWEENLHADVKIAIVQSLSKLLMINNAFQHLGMSTGECIQCLCPLVALFVFEHADDAFNACIQQFLKVFFHRYAQAHGTHQYLIRAGFVPILRYCWGMVNVWGSSIAPVIKFLANLFLAPMRDGNLSEADQEMLQKQTVQQNAQLVCLLLWEISICPSEITQSKSYVAALWKVILDLKLDGGDVLDKLKILGLLNDLASKRKLHDKSPDALKAKLDVSEALRPLEGDALEAFEDQLDNYLKQLGTHPFSESDDD